MYPILFYWQPISDKQDQEYWQETYVQREQFNAGISGIFPPI